ncbi:MAG TPA: DUF1376 domain-containing protein, partial [Terriglobia bacterium]|nr:DUF1376 domain-containing protein [Terriglobia bacterium]
EHLSTLEHGAYLLLILKYWSNGKALPASDIRLANLCRLTPDQWQMVKPTLAEFFIVQDGCWFHKRIEKELDHFRDKSAKARANRLKAIENSKKAKEALDEQSLFATDVERTFNERPTIGVRSTSVEVKNHSELNNSNGISKSMNGRSTSVERPFNYADADADNTTEHTGFREALSGTEHSPPTPSEPSQKQLQEISDAYDRHQKYRRKEPRDLVIQNLLSMNGKFDWERFRKNHVPYCEHYASHGWDFCTLTLLEWIDAGMPGAPGSNPGIAKKPPARPPKVETKKYFWTPELMAQADALSGDDQRNFERETQAWIDRMNSEAEAQSGR